ncbi:nuclear cap-binding protein subunit 1 isoform X2 [Drosophila ficusphila]|uniref:nuclear cap-binding protein subunit 1 isoform X2 n=1 Tax=Drosophila ficusphila TaxID=30025 RepID=UPI0007E68E49|nr:nuclear cap-binding protein subunit 1 isoform X2 [Drosophila ficusphila]
MEPVRRKREDSSDEDDGGRFRKRTGEVKLWYVEKLMRRLSHQCGNSTEMKLGYLVHLLRHLRPELEEHLLSFLGICVGESPGQASVYATLVGLLNARSLELGFEIVHFMVRKLQECINMREWSKSRGIVHFLVDLYHCKVVTSSSLLDFLNSFVRECEDPSDQYDVLDSVPQTRRDWLATCVLSALPLIGQELQHKEAFERLMVTLQIYVKKRCALDSNTLAVWRDTEHLDHLELLWHQVDVMRQEQWSEPEHQLIPRPYLVFALSGAIPHPLPVFQVPVHEQGCRYPPLRATFRLFSDEMSCNYLPLPSAFSIERYLLEAQIQDLLYTHHLDKGFCADNLLCYAATKPHLAVHHSIVEVILGEMLQLPQSQWITLNYGAILVELRKRQPDKIPQILVHAADILFDRLDSMNVAVFDRLVNWLSHHLSNFGFTWHWKKWADCLPLPVDVSASSLSPKVVFLRELIKKCIRLSYHRRIAEILPDNLAGFLPPPALPRFKYVDQLLPGAKLSKELLEVMRTKDTSPEAISGVINAFNGIGPLLKTNVFTQNCLHLGAKSFSHTFAIITKYHLVFKELAGNDPEQQHAILSAIFEVWEDSDHLKFVVSEKLLRRTVLESRCIVSWVFGPLMHKELTKMYIWELLHSTVRWVKHLQKQNEVVSVDDPNETDYAVRGILLDILHRFVKVLSAAPQGKKGSEEELWFQWVLGRLLETLFIYAEDYKRMACKLIKISGETDLREDISKTIQSFLAHVI